MGESHHGRSHGGTQQRSGAPRRYDGRVAHRSLHHNEQLQRTKVSDRGTNAMKIRIYLMRFPSRMPSGHLRTPAGVVEGRRGRVHRVAERRRHEDGVVLDDGAVVAYQTCVDVNEGTWKIAE